MKILHTAVVTPHRSGLYESVRDIVVAERSLGHDARIFDPKQLIEDRGAPIGSGDGVDGVDIIVNHSGLGPLDKCGLSVVHCLHGRPESSYRLEKAGVTPVWSFLKQASTDPQYKAFVTFWPEFVSTWETILDTVECIPPPVDLDVWTPDGPAGYQFGGKRGKINVVVTDMWRDDITPLSCLVRFFQIAQRDHGMRLHIYGVRHDRALDVILGGLEQRGILGEVRGYVQGLANVYRAADYLMTPHIIATRAIRESMACGCPLLNGDGFQPPTQAKRTQARQDAVDRFDSKETARQLLQICERVIADG